MSSQSNDVTDYQQLLSRTQRKLQREKKARNQAEELLESKSTELYDINLKLQSEKDFIKQTLSTIHDAVISVDLDCRVVFANRGAEKVCSMNEPALIGRSLSESVSFYPVGSEFTDTNRLYFRCDEHFPNAAVIVRQNGESSIVDMSFTPLFNLNKEPSGYVIVLQDVTETQKMLKRLNRLSKYDPMTSLPNRRHFLRLLSAHIGAARRHNRQFALLHIDIKNFSRINKWLGQHEGDSAIRKVGDALRNCVRQEDVVSRFNGDEFAVLVTDIKNDVDGITVAQHCSDALSQICLSAADNLTVSCVAGISLFPDNGEDANTLLRAADTARLHAKQSTEDNIQLFTEALSEKHTQQIAIERMLSCDDFAQALSIKLQPKWDTVSKQINGAETLLRCHLPDIGWINPQEVIALAEENARISELGWWIIRQACSALKTLHSAGFCIPIAVNISAKQLVEKHFVTKLAEELKSVDIENHYLVLELTESVMLDNPASSQSLFSELKSLGFKVSIDDFGTGYSSLAYLQHLDVQELKIDKTFVDKLLVTDGSSAIVSSIITLAKGLNLNVVAEGIEYEEQRSHLADLGCQQGQGYLISRPIDLSDLLLMLEKQSETRRLGLE
jgi:diguanylate cyclase (GGDEF)-like protein/PAS domain S-box-containing protein